MLAISLKFPAGKYHATPWDRHVNEGAVEWPPSSWRVLRALIAVYYRTIDETQYTESLLKSLINQCSGEHPEYAVPRSRDSHTRHYMPLGNNSTRLIYDAFAIINPDDELVIVWTKLNIGKYETDLLDELLKNISYLGRVESLVDAQRLDPWKGKTNCRTEGKIEGKHESSILTLLAPMSPLKYDGWRLGFNQAVMIQKIPKVNVPENIFDALLVNTNDLEKNGWNQPPGAMWVNYRYDPVAETFRQPYIAPDQKKITVVRWQLIGKPLPRILDAILIGEALHASIIKWWCNKNKLLPVPSIFTGRDQENKILTSGHKHAFYFAEDHNNDGYIDHMVLYVPDGIPPNVWAVIEALHELAIYLDGNLNRCQILLEGTGDLHDFSCLPLMKESREWESDTPYLHPWHVHKNGGFGVKEQLEKELMLKGYKDFIVVQVDNIEKKGKQIKPWHFNLKRRKKNDVSPDSSGSFWKIKFNEAVQGPISVGHSCHFGLGLFLPI